MTATRTVTWPEIPVPDITIPGLGPDSPIHDVPGEPAQWLILLPVVAAVGSVVLIRRSSRAAAWLNVGFAFLALLVAGYLAYTVGSLGASIQTGTIGPVPFGELAVPLDLRTDRISALLAVLITLIGFGIQIFARWYLWFDPRYRTFAGTISMVTAAMLLLILSDDVVLSLVGWQMMGWGTFLLIGHTSTRDTVNRAAGRALILTRIADAALLLGLVALAAPSGTTSLSGVVEFWNRIDPATGDRVVGGEQTLLAAGLILVVIGVLGRTAQFPFQDWLPDSVNAPTPATALLHSVTLVGAGAVMLTSIIDLLPRSSAALTVLAVTVAISIVGGALLAAVQPDLKRMLAWSTVSQAGLVLAAVVLAAQTATGPDSAVAQFSAHSVAKALLFLAIGWLAVLTGGTAVVQISGAARLYRSVRAPLAVGLLSLAGVPPTIGFVTTMLMIGQAEGALDQQDLGAAATVVLAAMGAAVPLTAAYCMRAWVVLNHRVDRQTTPGQHLDDFFVESEVEAEAIAVEEAESAISSTARLVVVGLMTLSLLGGVLLFTPVLRTEVEVGLELIIAAPAIMFFAALAVWVASRGVRSRDAAARIPAGAALAAERGWGMSWVYRTVVVRPVLALAGGVSWLDREVIDGYLRGTGHAAQLGADLIERSEAGRVPPAASAAPAAHRLRDDAGAAEIDRHVLADVRILIGAGVLVAILVLVGAVI